MPESERARVRFYERVWWKREGTSHKTLILDTPLVWPQTSPPLPSASPPRREKAVTRAASELSQAINALDSHHREEAEALPTATGDLARAGNQVEQERARWGQDAARLEEIAADLRHRRSRLLDKLEALRDPLVDLGAEAQSLLAEDALSAFFVEPYKSESAPRPIGGIEKDLTLAEWVLILLVNAEWTRKWTEVWVVAALGPCYMLSLAIEHPTVEATELRKSFEETCGMLKRFLLRQYT